MSPQNSYIETLTANVMIFGVGVFGKGLGHEVGALMMELMPSEEETKENLFPLSVPHEDTARRQPSANRGEWGGRGALTSTKSCCPSDLRLFSLQNCQKYIFVV